MAYTHNQMRQNAPASQQYNLFAKPAPVSQPSVQTVANTQAQNQAGQFNLERLERDHQGNYYVNGVKTPMKVLNPSTVPYVNDSQNKQQIASMDDLVSAMYTDPQQEEKLRKASVANQRIMAVGDALRHIGNIFNTVNYAPSQQFNKPWEEERNRYLQEKAYRDKRNQIYMTYQQQKAAQDAKIAQAERQFQYNAAKDARDYELKKNESEARQQRQNALAALDKARLEGQLDKNTYQRLVNQYYPENAQARINEIESRIAKNNRTGGGRSVGGRSGGVGEYEVTETKTYNRNKEGQVESYTVNKKRTRGGQSSGKGKRSSGIK